MCGVVVGIIVFHGNFYADFAGFLLYIIVWLSAWFGVFITDYVLRRRRYDPASLAAERGGLYWRNGGVHWPAIIALAAGMVAALMWINAAYDVPSYTGPISNHFPGLAGGDFSWALGIIVSSLVYWALAARGVRKEADATPAEAATEAEGGRVTTATDAFTAGLPKAELHLHIEGTLERSLCAELAVRNGIAVPNVPPFHDLTSFLVGYYASMQVLLVEADFYDLAMAYFRKARSQNVVYAEVFFDPQAHTSRGVPFAAVIGGLDRARRDAFDQLGLRAQLIMCFLRDLPADSAMETLPQSLPYADKIVGVGLDSDERGNPPLKFAARVRAGAGRGLPAHDALRRRPGGRGRAHLAVPGRDRGGADRPRRQLPGGRRAGGAAGRRPDRPDRLPGLQRLGDRQHEGPRAGRDARPDAAGHGELRRPGLLRGVRERELRRGGRARRAHRGRTSPNWPATRSRSPGCPPAERAGYLALIDSYAAAG